MQKNDSININLAKNRGAPLVDRVINFALSIGRILIILTELIALSAFLYRFTLDRTLVNLHDRIVQKQAIVKLLHDNEVAFRNLQDRLSLSSAIIQQSSQFPKYLTDIIGFAPFDMQISSIAVASDGIRIQATVQSVDSLTNFVNKLKTYPPISTVSLDRIDNKTETATITVSITAFLKIVKGKNIVGKENLN